MKIALFSESFTPYISGVARSVEILYKELNNLGHDVYVFTPNYPNWSDSDDHIIRFPSMPSTYPNFRLAIPYRALMPKIDFDIIHSHSPFQLGQYSLHIAKKKNIPFIYSFHTIFSQYMHYSRMPKSIANFIFSEYIRNFCNSCNKIIAPGQKTLDYIESLNIKTPVSIIPSGIDLDIIKKASPDGIKEKLNLPENAKILIYVGRLSKEKNLSFLLEAVNLVILQDPGVYLIMAAGGPYESKLKKTAAELKIDRNIIFAGEIKYPDIFNYYKCGDIFIFASKTETQGLVIAEAKACGLPVIAVNAAGISEGIDNGVDGYLVDEDKQVFSEKILSLLNNEPLRTNMGKIARQNSSDIFSSKTIAKKIESLYNGEIKK